MPITARQMLAYIVRQIQTVVDAKAFQDSGFGGQLRGWANAGRHEIGGRGGIRTHEGLAPLAVFKTAALNHSATLPAASEWAKVSLIASRRRRVVAPRARGVSRIGLC